MAGLASDLQLVHVDGAQQLVEAIEQNEGEDATVCRGGSVRATERDGEAMAQGLLGSDSGGFERAQSGTLVSMAQSRGI
jgi:hypothetical protein